MKKWMFVIVGLMLAGCNTSEEVTVLMSSAASTEDAMNEIIEMFNEAHPNVQVDMNYGGSGALRIQIEQGAPVDLFLSANVDYFNSLDDDGYISERTIYLRNSLVIIELSDAEMLEDIEDLATVDQLAIGSPESVPAGAYAKMALHHYALWDEVEPQIVFAEDVRQVLQYVEIDEVDAGIVYLTDAEISDDVRVVATFDEESHDAIDYPLGLTEQGSENDAAQLFYEFLQGDDAREVFESYGFSTE